MPVVFASAADARAIIDAIVAGGITTIEVTMTVPGAVGLIGELVRDFGDEALVGAGTVMDPETAARCIDAGAKFIISPALNLETVKLCIEREVVAIPGALTPTEIVTAWNAGADFVKVFPAPAVGGASYLRTIRAALPHIRIIPTGGVTLETAADFIKAGAEAIGVGGNLVDIKAIRENQPDIISERARQYVEIVKAARA